MTSDEYTIIFPSKLAAELALERLRELYNIQGGYISVSEMYEVADIPYSNPDYVDYGWNSLEGVEINPCTNGVVIEMPCSPRPIKDFIKNTKDVEKSQTFDNVNHPAHYMSYTGLETIDVIEAFTSDLTGMDAVCTANVIKYICRWKHKNGLEDLKKAQWYLNRLIEDNKPMERKSN